MSLVARLTARALVLKPVRAFLHYIERGGPQLADAITYRMLFGVFAGVLLLFTVAASWLASDGEARHALVAGLARAIPGLIGDDGIIDPRALETPSGLTLAGVLSLIGLVGAAIGAIGSTRIALRTIADRTHDDVPGIRVVVRNLALAVGLGVGIVLSSALTFAGAAAVDLVRPWAGSVFAPAVDAAARLVSVAVMLVLDAALVAMLFVALSGVSAPARALWPGAFLGGAGLTLLQQLSGVFVRGAGANPLLISFAALVALLLWFNLSAQVLLFACSYIVVGVAEGADRARERHGAATFAQRRVRRAEDRVRLAVDELERARAAVERS